MCLRVNGKPLNQHPILAQYLHEMRQDLARGDANREVDNSTASRGPLFVIGLIYPRNVTEFAEMGDDFGNRKRFGHA
jgi:hypothetical protein